MREIEYRVVFVIENSIKFFKWFWIEKLVPEQVHILCQHCRLHYVSNLKKVEVVLFCLWHWDLPDYGASCHALGTIGKPSMDRVHQLGFIMVWPTVEKLLNVK